jgi:hypothetical protein
MSGGSDFNKIITTVNSVTSDYTFIPDQNNLIVIDTSNNRIGINIVDPKHAIHVNGETILSHNIIIENDASFHNVADISSLIVRNDASFQSIVDISSLIVRNDASFQSRVDISSLIVRNSANIMDLSVTQISSDLIPLSDNNFSLGNTTNNWKELYIDNAGGIYFNDKKLIYYNANNKLELGSAGSAGSAGTDVIANGITMASAALSGNINMDQNDILDVSMISVDTISAGTINVLNGNLNMDQNNILDVSMISVDTISAGTINVLNGNLNMYQNDILDVSLFNVKNIDMLNPTNNDKGNITNVNRIYLWSLESVTTGPTGLITVLSDLNMNSKNISNTNTITTTNLTTTNLAGTTMTGDLNMGTNTLNYNLGNINETDWDNIINITTILGNNTRNIVHRVKGKDGDDLEYEINREGSLGDQDTLSLRGWDTINLYALPEYNQHRGIHMHGYVNFNSGVKMVSGNLNMNSNDILNTKSITTTNLAGTTMTGDLNMGGNTIYADTIRCNYIKPWNLFDWHDNTDSYIQMGHTNGDDRIFIIQDASTILSVVTSDDRLKHNEIDIYNGLNIIRQLVPQKYQKTHDLKDADYMGDISGEWRWESGFIAQDVLQIPDLSYCVTGGDYNDSSGNLVPSTYYLSYNDIFVYGLAATKELDQQVQSFQTIITDLSSEVLTLKQENANLYTQNNNLTLELNIIKMALNELLNDAGKNTV